MLLSQFDPADGEDGNMCISDGGSIFSDFNDNDEIDEVPLEIQFKTDVLISLLRPRKHTAVLRKLLEAHAHSEVNRLELESYFEKSCLDLKLMKYIQKAYDKLLSRAEEINAKETKTVKTVDVIQSVKGFENSSLFVERICNHESLSMGQLDRYA